MAVFSRTCHLASAPRSLHLFVIIKSLQIAAQTFVVSHLHVVCHFGKLISLEVCHNFKNYAFSLVVPGLHTGHVGVFLTCLKLQPVSLKVEGSVVSFLVVRYLSYPQSLTYLLLFIN